METPPLDDRARVVLATTIAAVTVYTDRALVTRRGLVTLTGAERELVVEKLPQTILAESIRAVGKGSVAVRLLAVRTETVYATEPVAERLAELIHQSEQLEEQQRALKDALKSLEIQRDFVQQLGEASVSRFSTGLARQQVSLANTGELLAFVGQRYGELSVAIAQQEKQIAQLDKQLQVLLQQRRQLKATNPEQSYNLVVGIQPQGEGEFELEVSYVCANADWRSLYDLRVDTQRRCIYLSYLAEVKQTTGEDWLGVTLTLSTAKPGVGSLPPKLSPWYINIPTPRVVAPAPMAAPQAAMQARSVSGAVLEVDQFDEYDMVVGAALPEAAAGFSEPIVAANVNAQINSQGGVVTFQVGGGSDIPGDGNFHKFTLFEEEYPCHLEYVAIPKIVSFAFLQAVVTNPANGATLLPGQANVFRDDMFVGKTSLQNVAPGQEFNLNLGVDEGLKLERELVERKVDKRWMNDKRLITFGYRLVITNLQNQQATLKLTEQIPVSRTEQIQVKLTRTNPQIPSGEMGILEWSVILPPNAKQEIFYQFTVEHSRELTVLGLDV